MNRGSFVLGGMWLVILLGIYAFSGLKMDTGLSTFTAEDSEEYRNYEAYSRQFPQRRDTWLLIMDFGKVPGLMEFRKMDSLCRDLEQEDGIRKVYSLTTLRIPRKTLAGVGKRQLLPLKNDAVFDRAWKRLPLYPDATPKFLSDDRKAVCVYLEVDEKADEALAKKVIDLTDGAGFPKVYYAGTSLLSGKARELIASDMVFLVSVASGLLLLIFFLIFRDLRSLLVTTTMIAFNSAFIVLLFWISGRAVNLLTLTIPLLIAVLSFSDIVHIVYTVRNKSPETPLVQRVNEALHAIRMPLLLTSLTTFLAFAVFIFSPVPQISEFGWITCAGIAMAFVSAYVLLPELILMTGVSRQPMIRLGALQRFIEQRLSFHRLVVSVGLGITVLLGAFAVMNFRIDNHLLKSGNAGLQEGQAFLNEHFGGTRSVEVVISGDHLLNEKTIRLTDRIEHYLVEEYGCTSVFSLNTVAKRLNRFRHYGHPAFYRIPEVMDVPFFRELDQWKVALGLRDALTEDGKTLKIVGRLPDQGSADAMQRTAALEYFLSTRNTEEYQLFTSGYSLVQDRSMMRVTWLIILGVALSLVVAVLVVGIFFRSVRLSLAILLPNLLPLLGALSCLQLLGIDLDPFAAMALSILLGLSIDDTIYITGTYIQASKKGTSLSESLKRNLVPVVSTTLLLAAGFGVLMLSAMEPNRNIGILVSLILLIALLSDLLLLPALLKWAVQKVE